MLSHLLNAAPLTSGAPAAPTPALYLILEPVDMRMGIDGLSALVQHRLNVSPCAGALYGFSNTRRTRMKLLLWDATGVWLAHRRLHRGHFVWPKIDTPERTVVSLSEPALAWLLAGVDWTRLSASVQDNSHWIVS